MVEVFRNLRGVELMQENKLGSSYIPIDPRKEFVILADTRSNRGHFLHPYGTSVLYYVYNQHPESAKA